MHYELTYQVGMEAYDDRLGEKFAPFDPHAVPLQLWPVGKVSTSAMLVDEKELLESRFYREFLEPMDIRYMVGFSVLKATHRSGWLVAHRSESQGRYGEADIRLLTLLAPHVCRSIAISDVLNLKTIRSEALEATLDALASGVYLTDREGRVLFMNRAAERQATTGKALRIVNNCLAAVDCAARADLAKAVSEATVDETECPGSGITIALPAVDDVGLVATVLPLNRGERQNFCAGFAATAAIFVQDPIVVPPLPGEAFAKLHGLTGSELRVLLAMSPGLSVKEAAEMLGIGETTAKTHLQHIFAKTNTSKQTELMHLFMGSAPPVEVAP